MAAIDYYFCNRCGSKCFYDECEEGYPTVRHQKGKNMNILNLYAGLGGNRALWSDDHKITAVEIDPEIAKAYSDRFPNDTVIVGDAHKYLLENYEQFDFIWTSPPYPTHGQFRYNVGVKAKGYKGLYPDMRLYEEIIFLQYHAQKKWIVENTISYYLPLIEPQKVARHYLWANFKIPNFKIPTAGIRNKNKISDWETELEISLDRYEISNKQQVLKNCVSQNLGLHVLEKSQVAN